MRDELEDLRAAGREKDQVIADLRAKLEDENQTVLVLTRKLKILLDKQDQRAASPPLDHAYLHTYVDIRIQRINGWFETKLSAIAEQFRDQRVALSAHHNRLTALERKTEALESSENALIDELEGKTDRNTQDLNARISRLDHRLNDLRAHTEANIKDLNYLSTRIAKLEENQ